MPRFINHENGTITDRLTGLMWQQSPSKSKLTLGRAFKWINKLNKERFAGYSDWRLPNLNESQSLVSYSICTWFNNNGFKIVHGVTTFWTSSVIDTGRYTVSIIDFDAPYTETIIADINDEDSKAGREHALAVRGANPPLVQADR